ncbi:MAG: hypothetical protein WAK29_00055, partial [Terriglobales bacterium]
MKQLEAILRRIEAEPLDVVMARERSTFDELAAPLGEKIVLFGAGSLGKDVLAGLRKAGVEPLAFADNRIGADRRKLEEQKQEGDRRKK